MKNKAFNGMKEVGLKQGIKIVFKQTQILNNHDITSN